MASILKNQIIKHLSAFARNLKPEQITMEVLRGKGQLRDLELNEEVLTEKLELPPWLKIVSARCDRVSINIPSWRKLKSAPIKLFVDELRVSVRLVSSAVNYNSQPKSASSQSKTYNLADRVIETLSLYVQSVEVFFESDSAADFGFGGSITLYSLALESIRPNWNEEKDVDINSTRIHDKTIRQVLFFKQLSWRLLKIEASAHSKYGADEQREPLKSKTNSPLRLLTVDGKCRISIKKNSQNCTLLAGKIELILKEIHWLATMLHLRMAIDFYKHILDLANCQKREDSKLFGQQQNPFMDASTCMPTATAVPCAAFRQLDIPQSSHHLSISKVDLLLLDDSESDMLPSDWKLEKGAMQAFLHRLRIDFYPENRVFDPTGDIAHRHHWTHYQSPNSFTDLARLSLDQHFRVISTKLDANKRERFARVWPQLVSQNVVIRLDNIVLQQVTDQKTKKDALRDMFSMDKKSKDRMPHSMSFLHLELSSYAFPASNAFTVPPDSVHLVMAPLELSPDAKSIRWLVYALESIVNAIDAPQISANSPVCVEQRTQIRIELFMPKIVLTPSSTDCLSSQQNDHRLPKRFILQASTILLSNFVLLNDPLVPLPIMFRDRLDDKHFHFVDWAERNTVEAKLADELRRKSSKFLPKCNDNADFILEHSKRNEWILSIPSLWINCDFGPNTWELPFLTDLNIFGSIVLDGADPNRPGNCILVEPRTDLGLTVDHFQFVQLTQLLNDVSTLMDQINSDRAFFRKRLVNLPSDVPLAIYCQCQKIHLRLILPSGPAPSPYDLKWSCANDGVSPSNTSISCSDLPVDESASNSVQFLPCRRDGTMSMSKEEDSNSPHLNNCRQQLQLFEANERQTAEIVGGFSVQGGLKAVESMSELSNVSVTDKLPLADVRPSRRIQFGALNLPDLTGAQTPSDLESNLDETLSIGTTNSAEHFLIDGLNITEDDAFGMVVGEEVVEAEEAMESVQDIAMLRRKEKALGRQVNVFDVLVEDMNIYVGVADGRTSALGFASNVHFGERLGKNSGDVYDERGASFETAPTVPSLETDDGTEAGQSMVEGKLKLEIKSEQKQTSIKVDVNGVDICVSDEVVSQLAPFIENPTEDEHPPALELSLQKCRIEVKDPKKKFPIRIRLGELTIEDGPSNSK